MRKAILALLAASVLAVVPTVTDAAGGDATPATPTAPPAVVSAPCTPLKAIYAEKRWREAHPMRGETPCRAGRGKKVKEHFFEYRRYRSIATMKCLSGSEGYFVPNPGSCSTLSCESGLSWGAKNPSSGAEWAYQLLGGHTYPLDGYVRRLRGQTIDGGPDPSTFLGRLMNHEIAGALGRSAWSC